MAQIEIRKMTAEEARQQGVMDWPIWSKEISRFEWTYDQAEECYLLEGVVSVEAAGQTLEIRAGDFVSFPQGLTCVWDVREPVRKHYHFPD